jgi:hypothetical protein
MNDKHTGEDMTHIVRIILLWLILIFTTSCSPPTTPPCPVTVPNSSTPPGETSSGLNHGNGKIWTVLWPEGTVRFEPGGPGEILPDGSLAMKFPWWRGEGVVGPLQIEGKRLDGDAPPLQADIPEGYGDTGFQASGLIFPSEGCWQVTGRVGEAELTFVTRVIKVNGG